MKKLFAILAVMGVLTLGSVQPVMAQDAAPAQTEQTTEAAVVEEGGGLHKELKTKFIEGDASFMSLVAIALVLGLAFCIERIIYLSLAETNTKKLMANIEAALEKGDVEAAKTVCRNTRGPVASICYQGLMRIDEGIDVVERSVVSYGGVQMGQMENAHSHQSQSVWRVEINGQNQFRFVNGFVSFFFFFRINNHSIGSGHPHQEIGWGRRNNHCWCFINSHQEMPHTQCRTQRIAVRANVCNQHDIFGILNFSF